MVSEINSDSLRNNTGSVSIFTVIYFEVAAAIFSALARGPAYFTQFFFKCFGIQNIYRLYQSDDIFGNHMLI
ncbi:hypothetical protein [Sphingobacterium sp. T2]|uniref:hypothetical protein n=1 Tax=Sphingobacterium sp. T2 TaxID=1590596 RepID=UPI00057BA1C7|nr:hypothetical protein [Sphingobacterium sp. T2]